MITAARARDHAQVRPPPAAPLPPPRPLSPPLLLPLAPLPPPAPLLPPHHCVCRNQDSLEPNGQFDRSCNTHHHGDNHERYDPLCGIWEIK